MQKATKLDTYMQEPEARESSLEQPGTGARRSQETKCITPGLQLRVA